ncbi:sugar ABC transporter substrate-binding protein [Streptococcus chenjunshii]|uniref:Sugar ABC transporter substrate-binding protein n=1 Tax=Streptococcus chenjunshii TaxID=2173853 RepID=A0A372KL16_9STRE|nr:sugar ABC transporter substrate-binding protein [Streptococcus chenjunshii]AXQ77723.1 sugar ABC transporter substrate-binding protein [Streptococcus chenjunshii]RFU50835.1 sugar ABC transporter substrate-binding protein [Streptococcus chenjunshii]RFU52981.1 sugar ABC transporter substrate-binding protein [Streptococcus chenjunshii]
MRLHLNYKKAFFWLIGIVSVLVLGLIYVRGTASPAIANQKKIGVTYMTMNNDFYKILNAEIKKSVSEHHDILYVRDPELDEKKQSQQITYFIEQKVDVIVINPVKSDSNQVIAALKKAQKKGIKIIAVDTQLQGIKADSTIVSDNYRAGVLNARNMMSVLKEADILLLEHSNTISATERIKGFLDTIAGQDNYRIVARKDTLGQTEVGLPEVREVIEQGTAFNVVMALNDRSALGALAAIKETKLSGKIYIYGIDGSPDMKNLLAGTEDVQATVAQSPIAMGEKTAEVIYLLTAGKKVKQEYVIPVELISKETIDEHDITGWQ